MSECKSWWICPCGKKISTRKQKHEKCLAFLIKGKPDTFYMTIDVDIPYE